MPQKGGVRLGHGSYGIVFGEPALPAIDEYGNPPPPLPAGAEYCSKVFVEQEGPNIGMFDPSANEQAENENAVRQFLEGAFGAGFNALADCIVIPAGDYYIDGSTIRAQWNTYYTGEWLGRRNHALNKKNKQRQGDWLMKVRVAPTPQMYKQVLMEKGDIDLHQIFSETVGNAALRERIRHTMNILRGVALLQTRDMIHGDLKSPNCVRMMNGVFKIIDVADIKTIPSLRTDPSEEGVVPIMATVFSYEIWPATICAFAARGLPTDKGGTDGRRVTLADFRKNWRVRSDENIGFGPNDEAMFMSQVRYIREIEQLVVNTAQRDRVLGIAAGGGAGLPGALQIMGGGGGGGILDAIADIEVTGNMLIENLKRTYMITKNNGIYRRQPANTVFANNEGWNQTPIIDLFKRIDIFSFGILLLGAQTNGPPINDDNRHFYTQILKLIAQCCYEDPMRVMIRDEALINELSGIAAPPAAVAVAAATAAAPAVAAAAPAAAAAAAPAPPGADGTWDNLWSTIFTTDQ